MKYTLELMPDNANTLLRRARLLLATEKKAKALEDFTRALEVAPSEWPYHARVEATVKMLKKELGK